MRKLLFISLLAFFSLSASAQQEYKVPVDYKLSEKEDYKPYEPQVKETIEWLLNTSLGKDAIKRREASAFFMAWLTGTPDVSIGIHPNIVNFIEKNPELLIPFTAGWVKYSLDNDYSEDQVKGNKAGIEAVVNFYNKNRSFLKKDKNVDNYAKFIKQGKLEEFITKKIPQ